MTLFSQLQRFPLSRHRSLFSGISTLLQLRVCCDRCSTSSAVTNGKARVGFRLQENWKDELHTFPVTWFEGSINSIKSLEDEKKPQIKRTLQEFSSATALGFDTEFVIRDKQIKICLVQLAMEKKVVIWHVNKMDKESLANSELTRILQGGVLKVGHASLSDAKHLINLLGMEVNNVVDTLTWANKFNCKPKTLQAMCFMFLNYRISKSQQMSNWNSPYLSKKQIYYAACDPWVSLKLYHEMKRLGAELNIPLS